MTAVVTTAVLTGLTVWLVLSPFPTGRLTGVFATATPARQGPSRTGWWRSPYVAAAVAGLTVFELVPAPLGWLAAAGAAAVVQQWVARAEPTATRRERDQLERDLPLAVDLIVACLAVGRSPSAALASVTASVRGPLARELRSVAMQLELGADPLTVWDRVAGDPVLGPVGRAFARAARSGSSVTVALTRCAHDVRRRRHSAATARASSAGVKAAGPLGLCFLPAFVLVGIVPTIVGLFAELVPT